MRSSYQRIDREKSVNTLTDLKEEMKRLRVFSLPLFTIQVWCQTRVWDQRLRVEKRFFRFLCGE